VGGEELIMAERPTDDELIVTQQSAERPETAIEVRRIRLVTLRGPEPGRAWDSVAETCRLGTHASNDVVIDDPTVSRFHCELVIERGGVRIRDTDSRNGTVVDGMRVFDAILRPGSVLELGRTALRFELGVGRNPVPLSSRTELGGLVGTSVAMRACFALLERAAASAATVLLEGETGTGKSHAARAIHKLGPRAAGPFVVLDCGASPPTLLESELFGHRRGAFTGATEDRPGVFEEADGGTLFIDEIGELPLELQPKLLRAIEDREVRRVGTNTFRSVDVRLIAATNRSLRVEVNTLRFRPDLYFRLAVVPIEIPPLRRRAEDVPLLAARLLDGLGVDARSPLRAPEFLAQLGGNPWPGNVRELRNHLERCLVYDELIPPGVASSADPVPAAPTGAPFAVDARLPFAEARRRAIEEFEREYVARLLELHGGNITRAAEAACVDRTYIHRLVRRHDLTR
jgi:transcriptional regulator with GAF, ATPase, and Fis domain